MIFDTHAHYDDEAFSLDRKELLLGMPAAGIGRIINVGASLQGARESIHLAEEYDHVYAAVGLHPDHVGELNAETMDWLYRQCRKDKTIAVGEIGLDYHWNIESHELQRKCFAEQLALAKEVGLPVNIHSRDAAAETLELIKKEHAGSTGGVIHCFSSSAQMAMEYVRLGYHIGIGGVVTFKNARVMKEVAAAVPLERIVLETDCPYLAPTPHRGERNDSRYISLVIAEIARIRGIAPDMVEQTTWETAMRLFPGKSRA